MLGNTYHLYLRPGDELIARLGGLHRFIGWHAADPHRQRRLSGLQPRGAAHDQRGGRALPIASRRLAHPLTPEKAADIQAQLGSDIAMVLDECLAHPGDARGARATSMERTLRWARRARDRLLRCAAGSRDGGVIVTNPGPGAVRHRPGRLVPGPARESARRKLAIGFEAYAIGGLSVGEPTDVMYDIVRRRRRCCRPTGRAT